MRLIKYICSGILPSFLITLIIFVFSNEKGLKYSNPLVDEDKLRIRLYKLGNYKNQINNKYNNKYNIVFTLADTSKYKLRFLDIKNESFIVPITDIKDQTSAIRKIRVSLQNGIYDLFLKVSPNASIIDNKDFSYKITSSKEDNHIQPKNINRIYEFLFLIYFKFIPLLIIFSLAIIIFVYIKKIISNLKDKTKTIGFKLSRK